MQRAQSALDNPALDVAVEVANSLRQPVVIFFAPVPFYPERRQGLRILPRVLERRDRRRDSRRLGGINVYRVIPRLIRKTLPQSRNPATPTHMVIRRSSRRLNVGSGNGAPSER